MMSLISRVYFSGVLVAVLASMPLAVGSELKEDEKLNRPQGVVVQVSEKTGDIKVFKVNELEQALEKIATDENLIKDVKAINLSKKKTNELDAESSTSAWYYNYYGSYYGNYYNRWNYPTYFYPRTYFTYYNYNYQWSYYYYNTGYYWHFYW